jgi:RecA-family ATPase
MSNTLMNGDTEDKNALSCAEIAALGEFGTPALIDTLFPTIGVGLMAGQSGACKSWLAIEAALEVSRGGRCLNFFQTQQSKVLYIDADMTRNNMGKRITEMCLAKGMSVQNPNLEFYSSHGIDIKDKSWVERLSNRIRDFRPGLVVFDTLTDGSSFNETSATALAKAFKIFRSWSDEHSCFVLVLDHLNKRGGGIRGCNVKTNACDTVLGVSDEGSLQSMVEIRKERTWGGRGARFWTQLTVRDSGSELQMMRYQPAFPGVLPEGMDVEDSEDEDDNILKTIQEI